MKGIEWLDENYSMALREKARKKIESLQDFEKEIPAVFIVHNLKENAVVYMSERGRSILGVKLEEIRVPNEEYHQQFFNPEDVPNYLPKIFDLIQRNDPGEMVTFFQQVRSSPKEDWTWYLSSTKIFLRDEAGSPLLSITLAVPIEAKHHITAKVERLLRENNFLRQNNHIYATLTKREKEILRLMALGHSSSEIAEKLHISEATASTHRRNIRIKIKAETSYDITRFAQAFDLI